MVADGNSPLVNAFDGAAIMSPYPLSDCRSKHLTAGLIMPSFAVSECLVTLSPSRRVVFLNAHPALIPKSDKRAHLAYPCTQILASDGFSQPHDACGIQSALLKHA